MPFVRKVDYFCAVKDCPSKPDGKLLFFSLPKNRKKFLEWISICGRPELKDKNEEFLNTIRVCAKHFEKKYFDENKRLKCLNKHATPTLFLPQTQNETDLSLLRLNTPSRTILQEEDPLSLTASENSLENTPIVIEDDSEVMPLEPTEYIEIETCENDPIIIDDDDSQGIPSFSDTESPNSSNINSENSKPRTYSNRRSKPGTIHFRCKYAGCKSISRVGTNVKRFFCMPSNPETHNLWKRLCNIDESVDAKHFRICEDHFEEKSFLNSLRKRLSRGALPKQYVPSMEIDSTDVQMEIDDPLNVDITHRRCNYPQCKNTSKNARLFPFPKDYDRNGKWKLILNIDKSTDTSSFHICSYHFEMSSFTNALKTTINQSAIPRAPTILHNVHKDLCEQIKNLQSKLVNQKNRIELLHTLYMKNVFNDFIKIMENVPIQYIIDRFSEEPTPKKDFTTVGKWKSLVLYKKNVKLYLYLQHYFHLPTITELEQKLADFIFEPGINERIFSVLKNYISTMTEDHLDCMLSFLEIDLNGAYEYDFNEDRIYGYENLGESPTNNTATKAVVFMVRGIRKQWIQFIAYYFISDKITAQTFKDIIISLIEKLQMTRLNLLAIVCNYSKRNHAIRVHLLDKNETLVHNGKKIEVFYDAQSLIKCTRNTLLKYTLKTAENKEVNLNYVKEVVKLNHQQNCKLINKFSVDDFNVNDHFFVVKVQLSHTVASLMETYNRASLLTNDATATVEFIDLIDKLFDSLNGSSDSNSFCELVSSQSDHVSFWAEMLVQIYDWTLWEDGNKKCENKQFIDGFYITMKALLRLWNSMEFKTLNLRSFNLDPLENFMETIRSFYKRPTCREFRSAFKIVLLNDCPRYDSKDLVYFNEENCDLLTNFERCGLLPYASVRIQTDLLINELTKFKIECAHPLNHSSPLTCCANFVLKRIDKYIPDNCKDCLKCFRNAFNPEKISPSLKLLNTIQSICGFLYTYINKHGNQPEFAKNYKDYFLSQFGIVFCETHHIERRVLDVMVPYFIVKYLENVLY